MRPLPVKLKIESGSWASEDIAKEGAIGADEALVCCVVLSGNSRMMGWTSRRGDGSKMTSDEVYEAWCTLTKKLATSDDLNNERREVCQRAHDIERQSSKLALQSRDEVKRGDAS